MFSDKIEIMHNIINLMDAFDEGDSLLVDTIYECVKNAHIKCQEYLKKGTNMADIKKSFKIPNTTISLKLIDGMCVKDVDTDSEDEFEIPEDKKVKMDAIIAEAVGYDVKDIYSLRKTGDRKALLELIGKADAKSLYKSLKNVLNDDQHIADKINKREESLRKDTKYIHVDCDMLYGVINLINKINRLINNPDPNNNHLCLVIEDLSEDYRISLKKGTYSVDEMVSVIAEHLSDPDLKLSDLKDLIVVVNELKCATLLDLINAVLRITNFGAPVVFDIEYFQTSAKISTTIDIMVDIDSIPIITTYRVFIRKVNEILKGMFTTNDGGGRDNDIEKDKDKISRAKALISAAHSILDSD